MIGEVVGNYQITGRLSEGGMGAVFRAQHTMIGKRAAVKVLLPEFSSNREIVQRFFNEARAATAIRHPGIVEIFDFGYHANGRAYIVMELLDGEPLSRRLAGRGTLSEVEAAQTIRQVASALAATHALGVVHRDLKPDNIFVVPDPDMPGGERTKLLDFGIAKLSDQVHGQQSKTRTGAVMGTPTYMSPEQCRGAGDIDHRSDLYSIGCILYELLTGRPPYVAEGAGEIIGAHLYLQPDTPRRYVPSMSLVMEQLVMRLLAKDPAHRVQSAGELAQLLSSSSIGSAQYSTAMPHVASSPGVASVASSSSSSSSTTLGGAAGQAGTPATLVAGKGSRRALVAIAVAALAGVIVAIAIATGPAAEPRQASTEPSAPTRSPAPSSVREAVPAAARSGVEDKSAKDPPAPPAGSRVMEPPEAARIRITLELSPQDSKIELDGKPLDGHVIELEPGAAVVAFVSAPGHTARSVTLTADKDRTMSLKLEPVRKRASRRPTSSNKTPDAPKTTRRTGRPIESDL